MKPILNRIIESTKNHFPWNYMIMILLAYLIPALYGILNRYFIGYMDYDSVVVDQSYEALEVVFEIMLEMFPIAVLALVAQNYHQKEKIKSILKSSIVLQLIITITFVVIVILFSSNFIDWIHTPESVRQLAQNYFLVKTLGIPFQSLSIIFIISIKAMKNGKLAIFLSFLQVLFNFTLDAFLISNYPFSLRLGLIGSAWNTFFSNLFILLLSGFILLKLLRGVKSEKMMFKQTTKNIFNIGKWTGAESAVRNIGYIMGVVTVVNIIGATEPDAIGGYNTAMWVMWAITLIPIIAWTESTNIAVGHAYGEKDYRGMKDIQIISTFLMGLYMIIWLVIGIFAWRPLSEWLNSGISSQIADYSVITFSFLIVPYTFFAIGSGLKSFFIGTGKPLAILISSTIVNLFIYIPLGIFAQEGLVTLRFIDFLIVSIAVFSCDIVIISFLLYKWGYRKIKELKH